MEKNWLIRTKSNHILGPISKTKLKELLESGSLKSEDEICSGNGFWMFVREDLLVQKYVFGEEAQPFNPVSEAENILTSPVEMDFSEFKTAEPELTIESNAEISDFEFEDVQTVSGTNEISLPDAEDLDYPELEEAPLPDMDLEFDDVPSVETEVIDEVIPEKKKVIKKNPAQNPNVKIKKSWLSDKVLFTLAISLLVIAIIAFYYRKRIIQEFLNSEIKIELINSAHAQPIMITSQKKSPNSHQ